MMLNGMWASVFWACESAKYAREVNLMPIFIFIFDFIILTFSIYGCEKDYGRFIRCALFQEEILRLGWWMNEAKMNQSIPFICSHQIGVRFISLLVSQIFSLQCSGIHWFFGATRVFVSWYHFLFRVLSLGALHWCRNSRNNENVKKNPIVTHKMYETPGKKLDIQTHLNNAKVWWRFSAFFITVAISTSADCALNLMFRLFPICE